MKPKFYSAINSAHVTALNQAHGRYEPVSLADGETEKWVRLAPYGEFPVDIQVEGKAKKVTQVMDVTAANEMKKNFNHFLTRVATWFKGIPYLEGHPDDPTWAAANGGGTGRAVGRIKELDVRDDGLYGRAVFNSAGVELLSGESPAFSGHSPHWRMLPTERPDRMRPVLLVSMGLTNTPNIPNNGIALNAAGELVIENTSEESSDETNEHMKLNPELLKRMGLGENPDQAAFESALIALLDAADTAAAKVVTAEAQATKASGELTAANSKLTAMGDELKTLREERTTAAVNAAITEGRITNADKDKWVAALNASYDSEFAKLTALIPAINTGSKIGDVSSRSNEGATVGVSAINAAVTSFAKENDIDVATQEGWNKAWLGAKAKSPDLFKG